MATVLVVDATAHARLAIRRALVAAGHQAVAVPTWDDLERRSEAGDAVIVDASALPADGRPLGFAPDRIVVTGTGPGVEGASRVPKPLDFEKLMDSLETCLQRAPEPSRPRPPRPEHGLVFSGPAMRELLQQVERLAGLEVPVLITGESGTGKELVAQALHRSGPRAKEPFVAINCGAIPADLVESELFGHERGSFTDASARHRGRFEQAGRGTIFLDELGELPLELQAKLLRVLQEREFQRVGGESMLRLEARVVAATNVDLRDAVAEGGFREDLYHRIAVVTLTIPPLRDRPEDLEVLIPHLVERAASALGQEPPHVADDASSQLRRHTWPGNVRELDHVLQRAVVFARGDRLRATDLPDLRPTPSEPSWESHLRRHLARRRAAGASPADLAEEVHGRVRRLLDGENLGDNSDPAPTDPQSG